MIACDAYFVILIVFRILYVVRCALKIWGMTIRWISWICTYFNHMFTTFAQAYFSRIKYTLFYRHLVILFYAASFYLWLIIDLNSYLVSHRRQWPFVKHADTSEMILNLSHFPRNNWAFLNWFLHNTSNIHNPWWRQVTGGHIVLVMALFFIFESKCASTYLNN